ncbi:nectin-4 isoform X2 [Oncorhynchus tshawytscha]|uniref:nectin-4 isoform X2 n=1 Tax=Oncorhynchus tshawytscha TaxID=74940 RepID=UPI000D0980D8|nr:nectin-4 isoform X2 [Oncorhynchus tshawytscha]
MKLPVWDQGQWEAACLVLWGFVCVRGGFVKPPPSFALWSLTEGETRLPCQYQVQEDEQVVQVSWIKELPDGTKEHIITAHRTEGQTEFGRYSGRVRFESRRSMVNSALLILTTEESDEGKYICHISTFPYGNFERKLSLTVWTFPISSLDPVVLEEGQSFRVAASCRSVACPAPRLTWDTDLPGQAQNRSSEGGVVSTHFSLHPLRSMNGMRLDCLVWHPALEQPRRISNRLVVQFPPDASVTGFDGNWYMGLKGAELRCESGGNPKPKNFTWTRDGKALPDGLTVDGARLLFGRALRQNDTGVYECVVNNGIGKRKVECNITVTETSRSVQEVIFDTLVMIIIGVAAGVLVIVMIIVIILVNRYHRRKNSKLEMALSKRMLEINTLSRQASSRRLNSVSTDPRGQNEDCTLLRLDSRMKKSLMSLEDHPIYKGSQSTLGGKWGTVREGDLDYLGRPILYQSSWRECKESMRGAEMEGEREERKQRVESYLKSSNMSLAYLFLSMPHNMWLSISQDSGLPSSLVPMKPQDHDGSVGPIDIPSMLSNLSGQREVMTEGEDWSDRQDVLEVDEADFDTSSYQISEALSNHFHYSNGFLRPKPHSNAILLHPRGQNI